MVHIPSHISRLVSRYVSRLQNTEQRRKLLRNAAHRLRLPGFFHTTTAIEEHGLNDQTIYLISPYVTIPISDPVMSGYLARNPRFASGNLFERPSYVVTIPGAKVNLHNGIVATRQNALIIESASTPYDFSKAGMVGTRIPVRPRRMDGHIAAIMGLYAPNYFHWLADYLPRLYTLREYARQQGVSPIRIVVPDTLSAFQRRTLDMCLPEGFAVETVPDAWITSESYLFASTAGDPPLTSAAHLRYVRDRILSAIHPSDSVQPDSKRYYISRKNAVHRRVLNESEVVAHLEKRGFTAIEAEKLSFDQQVALFRRAEIVISAHGAGLTNILFSEHVRVVEFVNAIPNPTYYMMAHQLGHEYRFWANDSERRNADFTVDLRALDEVLDDRSGG
jgi:hypothetical protein